MTAIPATAAALEADVAAALEVPGAPPAAELLPPLPLEPPAEEALLLPVAAVALPEDVTTTTAVVSPEAVVIAVELTGPVADMPAVVIDPVKPALYCAQSELPMLTTLPSSLAGHALSKQGAARFPIAD